MPILREYQQETQQAILRNYEEGVRQQLVVKATGTGKTVDFANIPETMKTHLPGKMLVFAHREELVDQAVTACRLWNPTKKVGKEMASDYADADCGIVVSCVASIGRAGADRTQRFGEFDIVICDEAHHSIAQTYLNVFEATGVLKPESRKLLVGFTATPKRKNRNRWEVGKDKTLMDEGDIVSLKSVYKKIVYSYPMRKAIKDGWLVPMRGFRLKTTTDLSEVKTTAGDYQQDQLSETVNTDDRNEQIVGCWEQNTKGLQTVAFTVDIAHAKAMAEVFRKSGVIAEAVWGSDPERASKLEAHKQKRITVLCNCAVLTEGYDDWRIRCIILARPTKSSSLFTQMVGRGARLQDGAGNLIEALKQGYALEKKDCYVIDVVDNNKRCSLVTFPSLMGLSPDFNLHGESITHAVDELEAVQEKNPGVDFSKLTDLTQVKTYVESIDLFAEPYTQEVKEFSNLTWMATQDGAYVLAIPEKREVADAKEYYNYLHEKLHITQNELDEWELSITTVETERLLGTYNTLKEAFETADDVIRRCRPDRMKVMVRNASWHASPASEAAKKYLRTLTKKKPIPWCLCSGSGGDALCVKCGKRMGITAGQASLALNKLKAK